MAEVATAYVSIMPSFKGAGATIGQELGDAVEEAADSPDVDSAGQTAGKKFGGGMGSALTGLGKSILGPMAAVAGAAAVADFAKGAIEGAGELQQSVGAIETIFGDSSGQMLTWSKGAAKSVGLTQNEFNNLGALIGSQLKNGGTAMSELGGKTNDLITLGADLSSMFGGTTSEAVEALSSALKGERDPIEKYGVSLSQSAIDAKAAEMGFEKVGGTLDASAQQAATLALIMDQTGDAAGNFAKEGDTLGGQQQRLSAAWANFQTTLGTALVPILSEVMGLFSQLMEKIAPLGTWLAENPELVRNLAIAFGILVVALGVFAAVQAIVNAVMFASPITWIILGIVALVAALVLLITNWDTVVAWLKSVWGGIVDWLAGIWNSIVSGVTTAWTAVLEFFSGLWGSITSGVESAWNGIVSFFTNIWNWIVNFAIGVFTAYLSFWLGIWNAVRTGVTTAWNAIVSFLTGIWNGISTTASTVWNGLLDFFRDIPNKIKNVFTGALNWLKDIGGDIIQGLINGVTGAIGGAVKAVKEGVQNIIDGAKGLLGIASPSKVFMQIGEDTGKGLELGLKESEAGAMAAMRGLVVNPTKAALGDVAGITPGGMPQVVTLVDADGSILANTRVQTDQVLAAASRSEAATRDTVGRLR